MAGSEKFLKIGTFLFNLLVIIGVLVTFYGISMLNSIDKIDVISRVSFPYVPIFPIGPMAFGATVIFFALLGCRGVTRGSSCMTITSAVFLLISLITQLALIVLLYTQKQKFLNTMVRVIDDKWDSGDRSVFDSIQKKLQCCGKTGAIDYEILDIVPPISCCENEYCVLPPNFYSGCHGKFQDFISVVIERLKYISNGLFIVELVDFTFTCLLANTLRRNKRRNVYSVGVK